MPDPIAPVDLSGGGGASTTQIITDSNGLKWSVDKKTLVATQITGIPGKAPASDKKLQKGADGRFYLIDPATGTAEPIQGMPADAPSAAEATVPGSGTPPTPDLSTSARSVGQSDVTGPSMIGGTPDLTVPAFNAQTSRESQTRSDNISQQNADTSRESQLRSDNISQQNADTSRANSLQNALADLNKQKELEYQHGLDLIERNDKLTIEAQRAKALELHQKISEDLQRSAQALTARGQDMSQATAERGQNLDYLGKQSYVSAGQYAAGQANMANLARTGGVAYTPSPTPPGIGFDPAALAAQLAQQALGGGAPAPGFSLPPPQGPAPAQFIPPNFEANAGGGSPGRG